MLLAGARDGGEQGKGRGGVGVGKEWKGRKTVGGGENRYIEGGPGRRGGKWTQKNLS